MSEHARHDQRGQATHLRQRARCASLQRRRSGDAHLHTEGLAFAALVRLVRHITNVGVVVGWRRAAAGVVPESANCK